MNGSETCFDSKKNIYCPEYSVFGFYGFDLCASAGEPAGLVIERQSGCKQWRGDILAGGLYYDGLSEDFSECEFPALHHDLCGADIPWHTVEYVCDYHGGVCAFQGLQGKNAADVVLRVYHAVQRRIDFFLPGKFCIGAQKQFLGLYYPGRV